MSKFPLMVEKNECKKSPVPTSSVMLPSFKPTVIANPLLMKDVDVVASYSTARLPFDVRQHLLKLRAGHVLASHIDRQTLGSSVGWASFA